MITNEAWLARHPYLQGLADLHTAVGHTADEIPVPPVAIPEWDAYAPDFLDGRPLLQSTSAACDLRPAGSATLGLVERLASKALPGHLETDCQTLEAELRLSGGVSAVTKPGLLRYLVWTILARSLSPVVRAFGEWRDEDHWQRGLCPTCGERPAMAQLVGAETGRLRFLSCGFCRTRWRYRRTACPFCELHDDHRLAVLSVEGEREVRIDYCEGCGGYLKTYAGEGNEILLLADWTSLHLDLIASQRGLQRRAASLYDLPFAPAAAARV
jgi:FdhE protein